MDMSFRNLIIAALLFSVSATSLPAQEDGRVFQERAGGNSLLFRGHRAFVYTQLYNGTYYWLSPAYRTGDVVFGGKVYRDVQLNIDAVRHDLLIRKPDGQADLVLDRESVERFSIGEENYVNLRFVHGDSAPRGYWQLLYDGRRKFLMQVTKHMEQDLKGDKRDWTGYDGVYRNDVYQCFVYEKRYCYMDESGKMVNIRSKADLLRQFDRPLRREIRRHMREFDPSYTLPLDLYGMEILNFVESR